MWTHERVVTMTAAIVTTLAKTGPGPESSLYLATGLNLDEWQGIKRLLVASGLITVSHNLVTLTPKGHQLAKDCEDIYASAQ